MLKRLRKGLERRKPDKPVLPRVGVAEFTCAMEYAQLVVKDTSCKKEQIVLLDFMMSVIREDLKTDLLSTIFYSPEHFSKTIDFPFPRLYYNGMGAELRLRPEGKRTVDLAKDCVLALPWRRDSMINSVLTIFTNEFEYDEHNHWAEYCSGVDICYVRNGIHSVSAGIVHKKGQIQADNYDISILFEHVHTDGEFWYNSHNNQELGAVFDFRVGIIYEIAKLEQKVSNSD